MTLDPGWQEVTWPHERPPKRTDSKYALCAEVKANGRNRCTNSSFIDGDGTGAEAAGAQQCHSGNGGGAFTGGAAAAA
eukprot:1095342-Lingulodinium_polyedra.AAC.1